ncbi:MAG: response regulator transcription factor [Mariprofundaceae bacterium]|nr:response regulator transcription factor [Mariprofundaceae bacterium]
MNATPQPIRVQIVDDQPVVRFGLRSILESCHDIEVVAESDSGECAAQDYMAHQPDIVIMDIVMPGMGGLEAMRHIFAKNPHAKIIVLSVHDNPDMIRRAMQSHAMGYLSKGCSSKRLIEAIRQVAQGKKYIDTALTTRMAEEYMFGASEPLQKLTKREFEIFLMLADGQSVVGIARTLHLSPNTVRNHQSSIMHKLNIHNKIELLHIAIQAGLLDD